MTKFKEDLKKFFNIHFHEFLKKKGYKMKRIGFYYKDEEKILRVFHAQTLISMRGFIIRLGINFKELYTFSPWVTSKFPSFATDCHNWHTLNSESTNPRDISIELYSSTNMYSLSKKLFCEFNESGFPWLNKFESCKDLLDNIPQKPFARTAAYLYLDNYEAAKSELIIQFNNLMIAYKDETDLINSVVNTHNAFAEKHGINIVFKPTVYIDE